MTMTRTRDERGAEHPKHLERPRWRNVLVASQVIGGALLVAALVVGLIPSNAAAVAATLTQGPVTLIPGAPYHSGQTIDITVSANDTLAATNRVAAGFPSGAVAIKVVECADPGGLTADLPKKASDCDYNTVDSIPGAEADGSMLVKAYTMYALPDSIVFGEPSDQKPACGTGNNECVLGIFTNLNDFTKPHFFSGAFEVTADPQAENAIVNGKQPVAPTTNASGSPSPAATLASTGPSAALPWLIAFGVVLAITGTLGRRRLRSSQPPAPAIATRSSRRR